MIFIMYIIMTLFVSSTHPPLSLYPHWIPPGALQDLIQQVIQRCQWRAQEEAYTLQ